jgi:trehalose 6-phosphate phosphatase
MDVAAFVPDLREYAILLDVDGTIVDLAPTPRETWVPATLRDVLARLIKQTDGAVALVSGRPIRDLDLIFAPLILTAIGGHGAELRSVNGQKSENRAAAPLDGQLKRQLASIAETGSGIIVEDKGYSLALHYRLAPEKADLVRDAVATICSAYPSGSIEILDGKFVVEVKHTGFNKATAVRKLMTCPPFRGRRPIFFGDDTTDEPVFDIVSELNGLAISVGRRMRAAAGFFETPQDVRSWLSRISLEQEKAVP